MEDVTKLITKLYRDLFMYMEKRYGGFRGFVISLLFIRVILLLLSKTMVYLSRNPDLVTTDETVNKKKLARGERIKRALRKVLRARGGEGVQYVGRVANFIENNLNVLASIIQLLFERIPRDLSVSIYDLYYRTGVI